MFDFTGWITRLVGAGGYAGVVFLMFLENVFPPIPSELVMPLAGFATARGELNFFGVIAAGTLGSVLGALPLYALGRRANEGRLVRWADAHGKWLGVRGDDIRKADAWFDRHGGWAVLLCRLVPGVRSLISIPAGMAQMPLVPFLLYTALGTAAWTAALAWAGRLLGDHYERVARYIGPASWVVVGALLVGVFGLWVYLCRRTSGDDVA